MFWRLWLGKSVSSFGTYVTLLGLQVLVLRTLHGGAQDVGWLNSIRWAPYLILGLYAGALVDRRRRQPLMVGTDLACVVSIGVIPVTWALGMLSLPVLLVIVVLYSSAALFNDAASMAFLPRLIARQDLQRAHARLDGSDAVAQTAGPAIAGVLINVLGAPLAILVDAASYLYSAAMMASLRGAEPGPEVVSRARLHTEIREGVRWIYRGAPLRWLAIGTHGWFAANAILGVAVPTFALRTLHLSVPQFGIAAALAGAGAVLGATISTAVGHRLGTGGAVIAAHTLTTFCVVVMAIAGVGNEAWAATSVLGAGQACHGLAMGLSNSHEMSYRQALTADHLQARTNTTMRAMNRAVIVVVAPVAGVLMTGAGTRVSLLVAAVIFGAVAVGLYVSPFRAARV
ncbi:MFS transporter [Allobranchiibius sp. GilTou73]|uniref:MFS transporter n=1 Tax=Allobranchiibius sp. GilTou73 TaxID=2904523 RepID=UPI001F339736|nr:MFS transporter [Allobranchiibius sp. GilTou73]UIJ33935.1 MFS transporter [Allobranchiibius sp. GilTou73]